VIDGRFRHADGVGDHLQRRPADTMLGEQPGSGADDAGLRGRTRDRARRFDGYGFDGNHITRVAEGLAPVADAIRRFVTVLHGARYEP